MPLVSADLPGSASYVRCAKHMQRRDGLSLQAKMRGQADPLWHARAISDTFMGPYSC